MIEGKTMYIACSLVNFYLNQGVLLYQSLASGHSQGNHLTAELLKIKEYIEKHSDGCTAREIKRGIFCLRKCPKQEVEASLTSLVELKIVTFDQDKYYPLAKKDHQHHQKSETFTTKAFEGGDQTSPKDHQRSPVWEETQDLPKIEMNSVEKNKSGDLGDLLVIKDHHPQSHIESDFSASGDAGDLFLEKTEKNNYKTADSTEVVQPVEPTPWRPSLNKKADYAGEIVEIVGFGQGNKFQIEYPSRRLEWVKGSVLKDPNSTKPVQEVEVADQRDLFSEPLPDLTKTPEFIELSSYWSLSKNKIVRIIKITEDTVANFESPLVQVIPQNEPPINLKFDDLVAYHKSPVTEVKVDDIVSVATALRKKERVIEFGVVTKLDSNGVWVALSKGDKFAPAKRFYAHRIARVKE